jgi:hypothetical protein
MSISSSDARDRASAVEFFRSKELGRILTPSDPTFPLEDVAGEEETPVTLQVCLVGNGVILFGSDRKVTPKSYHSPVPHTARDRNFLTAVHSCTDLRLAHSPQTWRPSSQTD